MELVIKRSPYSMDCDSPESLKINDNLFLFLQDDTFFNDKYEYPNEDELKSLFEQNILFANNNDSDAQLICGICFNEGYGTDINKEKAFEMFKKSNESDNDFGKLYYADFMYQNHFKYGGTKEEAIKLYTELLYKKINYISGRAYEGLTFFADCVDIDKISKDIINYSDPYLLVVIGDKNSDNKDKFNNYKKAADMDYVQGIIKCAECYMMGYGTEKDKTKEIQMYKKLCDLNDPFGYIYMAWDYLENEDYFDSFLSYQKSYELGNRTESIWQMAWHYQEGLGVEKDVEKALDLYNSYKFKDDDQDILDHIEECKNILNNKIV